MLFSNKSVIVIFNYHPEFPANPVDYCKNHLAYLSQEFSVFPKFKTFFSQNITEAMEIARTDDSDILIFMMEGTIILDFRRFLTACSDSWKDNSFCMGHILDRKEKYYEIHDQFFILDLKKWKNADCPPYYPPDKATVVHSVSRSKSNFHDDYTPTWIDKAIQPKSKSRLSQGSLWIDAALERNYSIQTLSVENRRRKAFLPRRSPIDYINNYDKLHEMLEDEFNSFFSCNTEEVIEYPGIGPLSRLLIPCSGLLPFIYLKKYGYFRKETNKINTALTLYDFSQCALDLYKLIVYEWDGKNYPGFIHENKKGYLMNAHGLENYWENFLKSFDGEENWLNWFSELRREIEFRFFTVNMLSDNIYKKKWLRSAGKGSSLLSLSNIFHYLPTSLDHNYIYRYHRLTRLLGHLRENDPELWLTYCFVEQLKSGEFCPQQLSHKAKDFKGITYQEFPWEKDIYISKLQDL